MLRDVNLVDSVRDSVSRGVNDLGKGSFTEGLSSSNNWGGDGVSLSNWSSDGVGLSNWSSDSGIGDWADGWVGNSLMGISLVGISLVGNDWRGDGGVGQSWGSVVVGGNGWVSKVVVVGEWRSGNSNTTLLTSRASLSFSNSLEVSGLGSNDLRGVLNWRWGNKDSYWSLGKGIAFSAESTVSSDVVDSDFITIGVDVSVASANIAVGVSEGSMGLSWLSMTVRSLA
jgi:hypothetical protein